MSSITRFYQWITSSPSLFETRLPFVSVSHLNATVPNDIEPYQGNARLGFLYQYLCSKLLQQSTQYQIELEEVQLQSNGKTLGALDFLLLNRESGQFEHWEVAIKFYLLLDGKWYGPNAQDRLDKKLDHMLNHQLKMSCSTAFLQQYEQYQHCQPRLLMQGRLYINPFLPQDIPPHCLGYPINPDTIAGYWCFAHQWPQINQPLYELSKADWAAGGMAAADAPAVEKPQKRFIHAQSRNGQFWFIVPDNWPHG
ncbi:DUF1853 family protein [Vibrio navarrensis]|uniref:DUF1853 family protein n=1 Tax=Vibrio navarrensis TaxID=29495 RepID=A0AAI9CV92_9VIBR|nr:DUF1853 family protein [Vibrio navarrensis]EGR2796630.1 DUF1853 family protein [Vibrio navarrensis]EJL6394462.1 DUF1853 family protein [Vibrio navarrensis]EKA5635508.1 DUF1853 family protein [Vibrio navarrensis]ELN6933000.1 DUF1853 family protein [Vibrio navarrensis]